MKETKLEAKQYILKQIIQDSSLGYFVPVEASSIYLQHDGTLKEWCKERRNTTYFKSKFRAEHAKRVYEETHPLKYSYEDYGKVFSKISWNAPNNGSSGTMFSWEPEAQCYGYCVIRNGEIMFKRPSRQSSIDAGKIVSTVGVEVLNSELKSINYKTTYEEKRLPEELYISNIELNGLETRGGTKSIVPEVYNPNKGKEMKKANLTKEDILAALCDGEAEVEEEPKTDLEARQKFGMTVYGLDGELHKSMGVESKKNAKKFLQNPSNLGKTVVLSEEVAVFTTEIPVVEKKD